MFQLTKKEDVQTRASRMGKGKKKKEEMKCRRKSKYRKQEEQNSKVSENNYTIKEARERISEKIGEYILHSKKKKKNAVYLLT